MRLIYVRVVHVHVVRRFACVRTWSPVYMYVMCLWAVVCVYIYIYAFVDMSMHMCTGMGVCGGNHVAACYLVFRQCGNVHYFLDNQHVANFDLSMPAHCKDLTMHMRRWPICREASLLDVGVYVLLTQATITQKRKEIAELKQMMQLLVVEVRRERQRRAEAIIRDCTRKKPLSVKLEPPNLA